MAKGIDISKYQQSVDFSVAKADGVAYCILRASLGSYTKDPTFDAHYSDAKAAGLGVGAYHYFYATTVDEAKAEAAFFLKTIAGKQFDYPVAVDVEEASIIPAGKSQLTDAVIAFCEMVEDAGYYICVYANPSWLNNHLDSARLTPYDLWLAHWDIPEPSRDCGMWQYTSSGTVAGITGRVDMNTSYKDYPAIIKSAGLNGYAASAPKDPDYQCIHTVTAGQSPWLLADMYLGDGSRYPEIIAFNNLKTATLYIGQHVKIPNR